jgi:hypothetical protein
MNIDELNKDDITDEFILANFDVDVERKERSKAGTTDLEEGGIKGGSIEDFLKSIKDEYDMALQVLEIPKGSRLEDITINFYSEYDYTYLRVSYVLKHNETDNEVIGRLKKSVRADIKKYQASITREEKERLEYEKLKKKYE